MFFTAVIGFLLVSLCGASYCVGYRIGASDAMRLERNKK
jgi:hypothetical protein